MTTAHAGRPDTFGCTGSRNAAVERREANAHAEGRETPQKRLGVRNARHNGASQAPSAISALRSPSHGREGSPKATALPAPQNKRAAERCLAHVPEKHVPDVIPQVGFTRLAPLTMRNSGRPEFR